jgi:MerR family transcriptional regulator, light-induced transcriptional regulator
MDKLEMGTNDIQQPEAGAISIAAVERDTGLSKDTLRVWERRYGFPAPMRDGAGERSYRLDDVRKLQLLKRLLDCGHRPGRVVRLPLDELRLLERQASSVAARGESPPEAPGDSLSALIDDLRAHDTPRLRRRLAWHAARLGVGRFVLEIVAPLTRAVGEAWGEGRLQVFEEHLYTEVVQGMLRQAIARIPQAEAADGPRVLLTTMPGEPHALGLLMAETMLVLEGCRCLSLGPQTPLPDIVGAATAHDVDVVALSCSTLMNGRAVVQALGQLRAALPGHVELWAGGSAPVLRRRALQGVRGTAALDDIARHIGELRRSSGPTPAAAGA